MQSIKALLFILIISIPIFAIVKPAFSALLSEAQFTKYRNLWIAATLVLFLSHSFWLYLILTVLVLQLAMLREDNKIIIYFVVLLAMPPVWEGVGGHDRDAVFILESYQILALAIFLPIALTLYKRKDCLPLGSTTAEKFLILYLLLTVLMSLRDTSATNTIRNGLYAFMDVLLPYYTISRYVRNFEQFRSIFIVFILAALLLSGIALYEHAFHFLLYESLGRDLNAHLEMTIYLFRSDSLRASVTTGQPIVLGYVVMVAIGFFLFIQREIQSTRLKNFMLALLAGGSFAAVSRGPWLGILLMLTIYFTLGDNPKKMLSRLIGGLVVGFALASVMPGGEKLINLLPFIGETETYNIEYRKQLLDHALSVIKRDLIFGNTQWMNTAEMRAMIQGQGIIDVTNSYIGVTLEYGLLGLSLYLGFFLSVLWGLYSCLRKFNSKQVESYLFGVRLFRDSSARQDPHYLLGVTLFSILIAVLFTIYTVSSITMVPVVYWALAGMCAAYIQMMKGRESS